ncbi:MAG TPA: hypothetical protein VHG90_13245 [Acidimicrobiales bacterium]|nr:hypothetical protein [Acidimicrobiales bacterium]
MGQRRRAEAPGVRQWDHDVAAANELDEVRTWVVWGLGADPAVPDRAAAPEVDPEDAPEAGRPANDIAWSMAAERDPEWASEPDYDRWVVLLDADEDDVDEWAQDDNRVRGYAPYLLQATDPSTEPMEGVLRPDRVERRTGGERLDAGRPH